MYINVCACVCVNVWLTYVLLVIFVLLALLVCHDDADPQGVKDGVISIGVVWVGQSSEPDLTNKLSLFLRVTVLDSLGSGWSLPYKGEL